MVRDRRFARSLALAVVAHLCAVGVLRARVQIGATSRGEGTPIELTLDERADPPSPAERERPAVPKPGPVVPEGRAEVAASVPPRPIAPTPRSVEESRAPPASPAPPSLVAPAPSSASTAPWSPQILRQPGGGLAPLGLDPAGGPRQMEAAGGTGEESAAPGSRDVGGLRTALSARDRSLGLGRGGPLIAALEDVTSGSRAPVDGAASFIVEADETGRVTAVRVANVTSDEEAWQDVASLLLAKMKNHPLRMRPGWRGLSVTLEVRSRLQLADGTNLRGVVPKTPLAARLALFPLKILSGSFDVTELDPHAFRRIDTWETGETPR
jgi:hypothetical protein